jgi:AcrR family transcriptional regulator
MNTRTAEFLQRVVSPSPAVLEQLTNPDDITTRILRAALEQFELFGIRRTTMEDVARRSGLGRATLYRRFANKDLLVDAIVHTEVLRYLEGNALARARGLTFEDRIAEGTAFTVQFLRHHALLNKLMDTEPETILPSFTVDGAAIIDLAREQSAAMMRTELYGDTNPSPTQELHLQTVAELHTRLTLSFILTQHSSINLETPDDGRRFARTYIVPMITRELDDHHNDR